MMSRWVMFLAFVLVSLAGYSQEQAKEKVLEPEKVAKKKTKRPDVPGSIVVELGINIKSGITPADFQKGLWGSRTLNVYYQYPIRLFKTKFSFQPGIGLSLERWKFTNNYTLPTVPIADGSYPLVPAVNLYPGGSIQRSQLINNYIEVPIEFRFDTTPEDIARSFNISVGARFGVLYDTFTKVDYRDNAENKSTKDKQTHGVNAFRYGLTGRMGVAGFCLFYYWNLTPMFDAGLGPNQTTMSSATVGISISGF